MKILIVDGFVLFRQGLVKMLESYPDFTLICEASSAAETLERMHKDTFDLVLLEINLPDQNGLEILPPLVKLYPDTKFVFLTTYLTDELFMKAIWNGAVGYLLKDIPIAKLVTTLRALFRGEVAFSRAMTIRIVQEFHRLRAVRDEQKEQANALTSREYEVLGYLANKCTNREIAGQLMITENTVKRHITKILQKLNLRSRTEAGAFARRLQSGLKDPSLIEGLPPRN